MTELKSYLHQFSKLRRAPGPVWTEVTKKQAPHKPLLLLALLDLIARGVVTSPFIDVREDLVELNELFTNYWRRVVPIRQTSSIAFPFSRLNSEPFWELVPVDSQELDRNTINSINTVNQLRQVAIGGRIDNNLFAVLQQEENRAALRQTLLESYFHRCALCGIRIVTPEGHTAVDAAHIVPWSRTQNDDIRNGMALCKLCHWAFDEGMLGVSDNYAVLASPQVSLAPNMPGSLQALSGRSIIAPKDQELWPAQEYLHWHRREYRIS